MNLVLFSGGLGSYMAARRVVDAEGREKTRLLFTDTVMEDSDLYRFLVEAAASLFERPVPADLLAAVRALPEFHQDRQRRLKMLPEIRSRARGVVPELLWACDGRDPWRLFDQLGFLGSDRVDPCSRVLKREQTAAWLDRYGDPATTTVHLGIDWTEKHRLEAVRRRQPGWRYEAPLCERPFVERQQILDDLAARGIAVPKLYDLGFAHNNCGGFCVKAGHAHFKHLLETLPDRYAYHEAREQAFRAKHGDVAFLVDRIGVGDGPRRPLSLRKLRLRITSGEGGDSGPKVDEHDIGGCACF